MLKRGDGSWLIPEPLRSQGTADEICRGVEWQHEHMVCLGSDNNPRMLTPMRPEDHAEITAKRDLPRAAKVRRLIKKEEEFRSRVLAKNVDDKVKPKSKGWNTKYRKKLNGKVVRVGKEDES